MSKSADAFRTISEVADVLDVQKHVLRFWEVKFPQIRPMKRGGGRRYYRPEDMVLLRGIQHLLHAEGYTIKGVQKILREQGVEQVKVHGLAATAIAEGGTRPASSKASVDAARSASPATLVNSAGRVRALPKSEKSSVKPQISAKTEASPYLAAIEAAMQELKTCRAALVKAGPASAKANVDQARVAKSSRAAR